MSKKKRGLPWRIARYKWDEFLLFGVFFKKIPPLR
jgi:hypothetical protein